MCIQSKCMDSWLITNEGTEGWHKRLYRCTYHARIMTYLLWNSILGKDQVLTCSESIHADIDTAGQCYLSAAQDPRRKNPFPVSVASSKNLCFNYSWSSVPLPDFSARKYWVAFDPEMLIMHIHYKIPFTQSNDSLMRRNESVMVSYCLYTT